VDALALARRKKTRLQDFQDFKIGMKGLLHGKYQSHPLYPKPEGATTKYAKHPKNGVQIEHSSCTKE
jgi:hypothetical protein